MATKKKATRKTAKKKTPAIRSTKALRQKKERAVKVTEDTPLLASERRFADEFLKDLNATQSAIRSGFSPKTAGKTGCVMGKKPNISAYIKRKLAEQSTRTGIEFDRIMREAARIAFANPINVMNPNTGDILTVSDDDAAAIQGIKHKPGEWGTEREIKFHAKDKALDLILKYGRISVEFEAKMAIEREKLAIQRESLELDKERLALEKMKAAQKDGDGSNQVVVTWGEGTEGLAD